MIATREELAALWRFLAAPARRPPTRTGGAHWVARALFFTALLLATNITLSVLVLDPLRDWAELTEDLPTTLSWRLFILAVVFAPVLEESVFRAGLRGIRYTLFVGPALIVLVFSALNRGALLVACALALFALATAAVVRWQRSTQPGAPFATARQFVQRYAWVFWGYAALFALVHIGNYSGGGPRGVIAPLLVLPQFLVGAVAGYLRLHDGLRSSVLLHAANNAVAVGLTVL